jgi:hypothetical protein
MQFFCGNWSENQRITAKMGPAPVFNFISQNLPIYRVIFGSFASSTAVNSLAFSGEGMNVKFTFHILSTDD